MPKSASNQRHSSLWLRQGICALIWIYRVCISPLKPRCCRFLPTCSEYALEAVQRHGVVQGGMLSLRRIIRCHPWGGDGFDPVPVRYAISCKNCKEERP